jgi:hypothetical protein
MGVASFLLLPFIPLLPGLGSVAALILGWFMLRQKKDVFLAIAAVITGGAGIVLLLTQVIAALLAVLGVRR